jgi:hypothetical protein
MPCGTAHDIANLVHDFVLRGNPIGQEGDPPIPVDA